MGRRELVTQLSNVGGTMRGATVGDQLPALAVLLIALAPVVSCGGGGSGAVSQPDFILTASPANVSMTVGTYSPPVQISVTGNNGFSGNVSVAISGLPSGAISSPLIPLQIKGSGSQQVSIFIPPAVQTSTLSLQVNATSGHLSHTTPLSLTVAQVTGTAGLQEEAGQVAAGTIEIQGVSADPFNPVYWQEDKLNWVPDVRIPMLAPLTTGPWQNIYSPWPLEQANGWRMFYGGWDGTDTPNDRVYSATTSDFLTFINRTLVIDHGAFTHVNNVNVTQLPDGSMHMICTSLVDGNSLDKPAYFSSPDGIVWNGSSEPYSAQLSDVVNVHGDPLYQASDYNGGNVLLRDNNAWTLFYSIGIFGGNGPVFRATSDSPPVFQSAGSVLDTPHYANDVKKFQVAGQNWYLMVLYMERVLTDPNPPKFSYSLSSDGLQFPPEQTLFLGAYPEDQFFVTPAFVTKGNQILGVLYGGNPNDLLDAIDQIFARWLQKKVVITDSSGVQYLTQGGYGPDRQWFQAPASGSIQGTMIVYAEDGVTPLGSSFVTLAGGKSYHLVLN
jgi:hypothetical protein